MSRETKKKRTNRNDTSHNNWDDTPHDEVRSEDTHGRDTDTRLGGSITTSWSVELRKFITTIANEPGPNTCTKKRERMNIE